MRDLETMERQCGALPVRRVAGRTEVMLVSSRETRRWVIPKGWPIVGLSGPGAAEREAYEEAGVEGQISSKPVGAFHYSKKLKNGELQPCRVEVFLLDVVTELRDWPEADERTRQWMAPHSAAALVEETELAAIIRAVR